MDTKAYEEQTGFGKTGQILRHFGEKQNDINAQLSEQMELLAKQLGEAMQRIAELEKAGRDAEQRLAKQAAEIEEMQKDIDRLRLTTKLNSNALDRLAKG